MGTALDLGIARDEPCLEELFGLSGGDSIAAGLGMRITAARPAEGDAAVGAGEQLDGPALVLQNDRKRADGVGAEAEVGLSLDHGQHHLAQVPVKDLRDHNIGHVFIRCDCLTSFFFKNIYKYKVRKL